MTAHVGDLKLQHLVELSKLGDGCVGLSERIERWLAEHDVVFGGQTIPFVLMPHFVSPAQERRIRRAVAALSRVLDRFCEAYPEDAALREELALPEREDALVRIDPGFSHPLRICRLDAFLRGDELRFLEFNADSPAGIGYTDVLHDGLREALRLPAVEAEFELAYQPMLPRLVATLLDAYRELRRARPELPAEPRLALVDAAGSPSVPEFRITCHAAEERGLETVLATHEDLAYDGGTLRAHGEPVHLVYRRALLEDCPDGPLVAAARDRAACVVNPFRARVANNKKLIALLDDPRFDHLAGGPERAIVRETVPWTRVLRDARARFGGWVVDLLSFCSDNRERLVLKPASDYGGHGVHLGMETPQSDWDALIEAHHAAGDFVVQEYVPVPEEMFPAVVDGHIEMRLKRFNVNPFGIGGRYAGMITRISDQAVVNVSAGGGLLPSVVGRHRRRLLAGDREREEELHERTA
jgi:hypothetical protein